MVFYARVVPAKTPPALVAKLNSEAVKAVNAADVVERLEVLGVDALGTTPAESAAFLSDHVKKMKEVLEMAGVKTME